MFRHSFARRLLLGLTATLGTLASAQNKMDPAWIVGGSLATAPPQYSYNGAKVLFSNPKGVTSKTPVNGFRVYDSQKGTCLDMLTLQNGAALGATFTSDAKGVYYGALVGSIYTVWRHDLAARTERNLHIKESGPITQLCASPDGKLLAYYVAGTTGGTVNIFNLSTDKVVASFAAKTASLGFTANSSKVVVSGPAVYDLTGQKLAGLANGVNPVAISPDGASLFMAVSTGSQIRSYNSATLATNWTRTLPAGFNVDNPTVSSDGKCVLFAGGKPGFWLVQEFLATTGAPLHGEVTVPLDSDTKGDVPWIATNPVANQVVIGPGGLNPHAEAWTFDSTAGTGSPIATLFETSYSAPYSTFQSNGLGLETFASLASYVDSPATAVLEDPTGNEVERLPANAVKSPTGVFYYAIDSSGISLYDYTKQAVTMRNPITGILRAGWSAESTVIWILRGGPGKYEIDTLSAITANSNTMFEQVLWTTKEEVKDVYLRFNVLAVVLGEGAGSSVYVRNTNSTSGMFSVTLSPDSVNSQGIQHIVGHQYRDEDSYIAISEVTGMTYPFSNVCRVYRVDQDGCTQLARLSYPMAGWKGDPYGAVISPDLLSIAMYNLASNGNGIDPLLGSSLRFYRLSDGLLLKDYENQFTPAIDPTYATFTPLNIYDSTLPYSAGAQGAIVAVPTPSQILGITSDTGPVYGGVTSAVSVSMSKLGEAGVLRLSSSAKCVVPPASYSMPFHTSLVRIPMATHGVDGVTNATISATYYGLTLSTIQTVMPADSLTATLSSSSVRAGTTVTGTVQLNAQAGPSGVVLKLVSNNACAKLNTTQVTIPANATKATFTIQTTNPAADTAVQITASAPNYTGAANLTVKTIVPSRVTFNRATIKGGSPLTLTVLLPAAAPTPGVTYTLTSDTSALTPPKTILIPTGSTSASFQIPTNPVLANTVAPLHLSTGGVVVASASSTVLPPVVKTVTPSVTTATGATTATATVVLDGPAPTGYVITASSNNKAISVPATTTFTAGKLSMDVKLTIAAVSTKTVVTVTVAGRAFLITLLP